MSTYPINNASLAYDIAFEIVLGGDRFDKNDVRCIVKELFGEHGFTDEEETKFREQVKENVRKIAPPSHNIDAGDYYPMAINYWTSFPELKPKQL